ncbi:putative chromatin remodeling & transcription regulator BTB-POZ family [Helianthus debilis subsp. tardiflorus]
MKNSKLDPYDRKTSVMTSYFSPEGPGDFGFAFNDSNFSDRVLRIEIVSEPLDSAHDGDGCASLSDWARNRKRRREDIKKETAVDIAAGYPEEQLLDQPDHLPDDDVDAENPDEEPVEMVEEAPSDDNDSNGAMECSTVVRVETLHISSPILAARSPFFYELFSNGVKESRRHVNLRINASEEAALMELLNFMYSNNLTVSSAPALLDVLLAADKFKVASCMRYCSHLLRNLPMTPESAVLYLELPSSVLMVEAVQPLTAAAKQFLAVRYKDITKFQDEVLKLPLSGVEAIISSDDLHVASEDIVFDFVLKWVRAHYPNLEDRRQILGAHLAKYIRFPYMTCRKLRKVMTCTDFDPDFAQKVVTEALFFKADAPHKQRSYISDENSNLHHRFIERAYKYLPVKVVEFEQPRPQCVVYLDLKHEECARLFPSGRVYSQAFHLSGQGFFLSAHCNMDQQSSFHCFGLFLGMQEKGSVSFAVDYEFSARSKPGEEFVSKYKGTYVFTGGKAVGYRNLFATPWTSFIGEDSVHFIDGVLHLKAELTIRH